ncbi:Inhibitor of apoptosis 1 [Lonomia obliqua multiple nucleopolyhedrovirus]|uniref:Inhibitor of apoptosis 1 n=1 Tax=Lonomia obliqua multiple nucleopolyhedrovirus TaxID=134394 RepID=A0A126FCE3_9ABAC|nr:Inhibitor of apoptosis 1 [Lonomia obliqua multiple nucleopolyhedrovirus]AKN81071.1 Inhibitor of apoptosis 1 [Lonomia obliqua multiple nucleopolyhedrovirus]
MENVPLYLINFCETMHNHELDYIFTMLINRYNSFESYPIKDNNLINTLVVNGFKYNQVDDNVVCEYCDVEISNWSPEECVELVHYTASMNCSYASKIIKLENLQRRNHDNDDDDDDENSDNNSDRNQTKTIVIKRGKPKCLYRFMSATQSRVNTFLEYWPFTLKKLIKNIAEAGLFYTGHGDETVCFFCGCHIRDWHPDDNAWRRHALENSQCFFVVSVKGKDCVANIEKSNIHERDNVTDELVESSVDEEGAHNQKLELECTVCLEHQRDTVLLPCRHFCVCSQCYFSLDQKCPTCRQDVSDFIKVFVA